MTVEEKARAFDVIMALHSALAQSAARENQLAARVQELEAAEAKRASRRRS